MNRLVEMWTHRDDAVFERLEQNERLDVVDPTSSESQAPCCFLTSLLVFVRTQRQAARQKHCRKTRRDG
jgi:hypothetical protein